jgi:hypothetical protein
VRKLLFYFALLLAVIYFGRNWFGKWGLEWTLSQHLKARVHVEGMHMHVRQATVSIESITVENPPNYPETSFLRLERIFAEWNYGSLLKGLLDFQILSFYVPQLVVVKTPLGGSNVSFFHNELAQGRPFFLKTRVRNLRFGMGELVLKDYSENRVPQPRVFVVNPQPINAVQPTNLSGAFRLVCLFVVSQPGMPPLGVDPRALEQSIQQWLSR